MVVAMLTLDDLFAYFQGILDSYEDICND